MKQFARLAVFALAVSAIGCSKTPIANVEITESSQPKTPLSSQHMHIAVMNANMADSSGEFDQDKWSKLTADMIQSYLERAAEQNNIPIKLIDREHLKMTMGEKDLAAAGVTDSGDNVAAAQVKGASAILTSKVTVKIDKQVGKKRTIDAMSLAAGAWSRGGFGAGSVDTEQVDEEARNITVSCQFQIKDAATNEVIISHNGMPSQEFTRTSASPFFGSSKTEADMSPRDQVIGGMIEHHAQDFLAKFIPMSRRTDITVKPSSDKNSIAGVNALVADDYEGALAGFKQAIATDPTDHRSCFGAGVSCEKLGRRDEARKYYKQAKSYDNDNPQYVAAVARIERM